MARPLQYRHVLDLTVPAFTSSQPSVQIVDKNFPAGDEGLHELYVRWAGTFNTSGAAGAVVTNGAFKILRGLTVETDKHLKLVDNVDGLGLARLQSFEQGAVPANADPASTADGTTFNGSLRIPFAGSKLARPYDTLLDMKQSRMTVKTQFGIVTDIQSAGTTATVNSLRQDIDVRVLPGPLNPGIGPNGPDPDYSELPGWINTKELIVTAITSSQNGYQLRLPYGDRIYKKIAISQRTVTATTNVEVATVITANQQLSLKYNNVPFMDRMTWQALADENKAHFGLETMPTGWAVLEFDKTGRYKDFLSVLNTDAANLFLEMDVTAVLNGYLYVYLDCLKPIPAAALR